MQVNSGFNISAETLSTETLKSRMVRNQGICCPWSLMRAPSTINKEKAMAMPA